LPHPLRRSTPPPWCSFATSAATGTSADAPPPGWCASISQDGRKPCKGSPTSPRRRLRRAAPAPDPFQRMTMLPRRMHGFTLVESLVSLVVLSVGMIGIAALYTQGLGAGRTAQYRSLAVNLVADMADRIRANRLALGAYAGAAADNDCDPSGG